MISARSVEAAAFVSRTAGGATSARIVVEQAYVSTGEYALSARIVEAAPFASMGNGAVRASRVEDPAGASTGEYALPARIAVAEQTANVPASPSRLS